MQRVEHEEAGILAKREIIDVITTIAVYKFANLSREEVETMLDTTLKETQIARELRKEGREKGRAERETEMLAATVPVLLEAGMTVEQISEQLQIEVEAIRQAAQKEG